MTCIYKWQCNYVYKYHLEQFLMGLMDVITTFSNIICLDGYRASKHDFVLLVMQTLFISSTEVLIYYVCSTFVQKVCKNVLCLTASTGYQAPYGRNNVNHWWGIRFALIRMVGCLSFGRRRLSASRGYRKSKGNDYGFCLSKNYKTSRQ